MLGLIVITRRHTSLFFKVLTCIVITRTPTHFVKTVQIHTVSLLQHKQSSPPSLPLILQKNEGIMSVPCSAISLYSYTFKMYKTKNCIPKRYKFCNNGLLRYFPCTLNHATHRSFRNVLYYT